MDAKWQRCLTLFLATIEDRSGSLASRRSYNSVLSRFLATLPDPSQATRADVLRFLQGDLKASSKNARKSIIASFFTFASGYEIDGTPLFQRPLPTLGLPHLKPAVAYHSLTSSELSRLFAAMPVTTIKGLRDRALYLCYFWTTRRRAEIIGLRWRDIEPVTLDGRATHLYRYRQKGTSRTVRTAELPVPAWNAIVRYLEASGRLETMLPDSPVFVSVHPGQGYHDSRKNVPLNRDYANREFKKYAAAAGLSPDITLHSLRHSAARARYEAGSDIRAIQQVLGHASLATTDTYLRVLVPLGNHGAVLLEQRYKDL
jgi:site-specific recombinase XerD